MNSVLVSILMPVYNGEKTIGYAIDSILRQSFKSFELIIIDDGSTDSTAEIINTYVDKRIKYYKNKENIKLIETLNVGLELCSGKYIARLDSDDIALPNRLAVQVEYMERFHDVVVCGSQIEYIDENGLLLKNAPIYPLDGDDLISYSLFKSPIAHPAAMIRRSVLLEHNIDYDSRYPHAEDVRLWFELMKYGRVVNTQEILIQYRISDGQISNKYRECQKVSAFKARKEFVLSLVEELGGQSEVDDILTINTQAVFSKVYSVELSTFILSLKSKLNLFTRIRLLLHVIASRNYFYTKLALGKTMLISSRS